MSYEIIAGASCWLVLHRDAENPASGGDRRCSQDSHHAHHVQEPFGGSRKKALRRRRHFHHTAGQSIAGGDRGSL